MIAVIHKGEHFEERMEKFQQNELSLQHRRFVSAMQIHSIVSFR